MDCPFCLTELHPVPFSTDLRCDDCDRVWYQTVIAGEPALASRPRQVRIVAPMSEGVRLDDVIEAVEQKQDRRTDDGRN